MSRIRTTRAFNCGRASKSWDEWAQIEIPSIPLVIPTRAIKCLVLSFGGYTASFIAFTGRYGSRKGNLIG